MKLLDLLVQELPKRGGWPGSHYDGEVMALDGVQWSYKQGCYPTAYSDGVRVIRSEYEAALAALQQPAWNGEGLPPVGAECEYSLNSGGTWHKCKIDYILGTQGLIMLADVFEGAQYVPFFEYDEKLLFRPIRSEADKKRDETKHAIAELCRSSASNGHSADLIYDAIAAGKIPGVKLED